MHRNLKIIQFSSPRTNDPPVFLTTMEIKLSKYTSTRLPFFGRRGKKERKKEEKKKSSLYECCMHNCRGNIRTLLHPSPSSIPRSSGSREINAYRPEVYSHNVWNGGSRHNRGNTCLFLRKLPL